MYLNKYYTYQGENCYTACVYNILKYMGVNELIEAEILCSNEFLNLLCRTEYDAVFIDNVKNSKMILKEFGINVVQEKYQGIEFLKRRIKEHGVVMLHINSRKLQYSKVFTSENQENRYHYVNILDINEKDAYISDGYIPDKNGIYEGWVSLENLLLESSDITYIEHDNDFYIDKEICVSNIHRSINSALKSNGNVYKLFCDNMRSLKESNLSVKSRKHIAYEMAVTLGIGGAKTSIYVLKELLVQYGIYDKEDPVIVELVQVKQNCNTCV